MGKKQKKTPQGCSTLIPKKTPRVKCPNIHFRLSLSSFKFLACHPTHARERAHRAAPARGSRVAQLTWWGAFALDCWTYSSWPDSLVVMVKTSAKPMSVELKQLVALTSASLLSPGSAKIMSTHWGALVSSELPEPVSSCYIPSTEQRRGWRARRSGWSPCRQPLPSCSWAEAPAEGRWFRGRGCWWDR